MKVQELMIRDVQSCSADDDLNRAAQIMWEYDCGVVPVVDSVTRVVGMITDRDLCMAAYTQGLPLGSLRVGDSMSKEVFSSSPGESLESALTIMRTRHVRRLPVIDDQLRLVGILSLGDLAREAERKGRPGGRAQPSPEISATLAAICEPRGKAVLARAQPKPAAKPREPRVGSLSARQADVEC
jgi:CBS domain-containing protein